MEERVGLNFVSNIKEITDFYDIELSSGKLIPTTKRDFFYLWGGLLLLVIGVMLLFIFLLSSMFLLSFLSIGSLLVSLTLGNLAIKSRNESLKSNFENSLNQRYLSLPSKKPMDYVNDILFGYRTDRIATKLNSMRIDNVDYITRMAEHLESLSKNTKSNKWIPIGTIGVFLIPLWTEFVGKYLTSLYTLIFLFLLGLVISFFVVMLNNAIRMFLWSEAEKNQEIANIMRVIIASKI